MARVTVVIPVHNRVNELPETLTSVARQSLADFETIIVDDASDEDVAPVVEAMQDDRFCYVRQSADKRGAPAARNRGAELAASDLIIFLDSDDWLEPECLQRRVQVMDDHPELDFAVWRAGVFRRKPGDLPQLWNDWEPGEGGDLDRFLTGDTVWQTTGPIWRKSTLEAVGGWEESLLSGQDLEIHVRACARAEQGRLRYEKFEEIDHHWRRASGERESIGKSVAMDVRHPQNRAHLLRRIYRELSEGNLLTPERRTRLGGQFFLAAEDLAKRVSRREGRQLWAEARQMGLVPASRFISGWTYLAIRDELLRARMKRRLISRWPPGTLPRRGRRYLAARRPGTPPPRLSVVMPVHNGIEYLEEAIESVRRQTFPDFELICVDDGSTDGSGKLLDFFAADDGRIRVIHQPGAGVAEALNRGVAETRTELVARMDADDISVPERFADQLEFLDAHPEVVCVGTRQWYIDPSGAIWGESDQPTEHEEIERLLLSGWGAAMQHPSVMFRRDAFETVGGYRKEYETIEDLDLYLRLATVGRLANLPDKLLRYRLHHASATFRRHRRQAALVPKAVAAAYEARGEAMPANWSMTPWTPRPAHEQLSQWAWQSLQDGKPSHARRFALQALRHRPTSPAQWKLLACAARGR